MSPDFFYEFSEIGNLPEDFGGLFATAMIIYLVLILLMYGYSILVYVLQSLGFYTVANRRGIHHPWLAWLPVCNMWIMGSISDQYQYVCKGKVTNRRKILIGLNIAMFVLILVFFVAFILAVVQGVASEVTMTAADSQLMVPLIIALVAYIAMLVVAIVLTVFQYVCVYDLFASCSPNNAVTFLVLSIFFTFLLPFFVFAVRKKDLGMPPRRPRSPAQHIPWQPPAPNPHLNTWQPPVANPAAAQPAEEAAPIVEAPAVLEEDHEE